MANSANPEINKKIATSALGTLVIATVFFYLGDRYAETLVTYPGQIFDHLSDAFLSMWQTIKDAPFALDMTSNSLLFGGACFLIIWMIWLRYVAFIGNYRSGEESGSARWGTVKEGNRSDSQYLKEEHREQAPAVLAQAMKNLGVRWPLDYRLHSKAFNDGNVTAHHGIIPQEADAPVSAMEPDEAKVYTAICERYAVQFLPPAVYDVSESTVSVDGGTLKLTAKRLSDAGFTAVFPNISNSRVREDSDTGNPWVPAGSHTLAGISCSITEGETTPPAPYTEGTLITDMASIAKYVKDPEIREILKRKDDGKKGEHGGIGTTATRSSIIEGLKTRGYLEERKGKVRATDKAKAFYALLPPEIRGADVTARWWLIQQDIADGKADVNALQDSVIEVFNHHRETAYVGASIAGAGKTVVGKCPRCGKDVIKTGSIYACSSIKNEKQEDGTWKEVAGCGFKLFGFCTKKFTEKQAASLLDGKAVSLRGCKSKAGKTFDCTVVLQKDGSVEPIFTPRKPTKKGRR